MGYYKVPQDVEAEDKLLGPFTFKQFIFLIAFVISMYLSFVVLSLAPFLLILLLPLDFVFALLAFYHPPDQPVENKVIAYLNFWFRPRKRLWSRDGIVEHVKIKVPKKIEDHFSDGRSQAEVRSQLKQLAQIVDTRGWASKRADIQEPVGFGLRDDDRLIKTSDVTTVYDETPDDVSSEDIYDNNTNPVAQAFNQQTTKSEQLARQELIEKLRQEAQDTANSSTNAQVEPAQNNYFNPYDQTSNQTLATDDGDEADEEQNNQALHQRIKELESNQELSVSSIAARAQELEVEHTQDSQELNIQH